MLYENDNYIAILSTKKSFFEVFRFYKTIFFTKAYENFLFDSAVGPLISEICMRRTPLFMLLLPMVADLLCPTLK